MAIPFSVFQKLLFLSSTQNWSAYFTRAAPLVPKNPGRSSVVWLSSIPSSWPPSILSWSAAILLSSRTWMAALPQPSASNCLFFLICLLWQVVLVLIPSVQLGAQIAGRRVQDKHPNRLVANQWIWMTKYNPYKHFFPRKRQCFIGLTETRENRIIWKTTLSSDSQCGAKTPTIAAPDSQVEFLYVQAQTCLAKYF